MTGGLISRKKVPIPSDLMGLAKEERVQRLLKSTFQLVDEKSSLSGNPVFKLKDFIARKYLITLKNYGSVALRSNKADLELAVKTLRKYILRYQRKVATQLQKEIDANRNALAEALLPTVVKSPPARWRKFMGASPKEDEIHSMLESELNDAFGSAEENLKKIEVKLVFKGITYELLTDNAFIQVARKAIPSISKLHEEYDAAREAKSPQERERANHPR
ncbi:MAG: hypothetical protein M1132_01540 [Chloroflexi bacterium]|nr:hypothetical protein [Chloroflexota bacterium]